MTRALRYAPLALTLVGCRCDATAVGESATAEVVFRGTCDASGAVPLGGARLVVADDEDNVLRVYDGVLGGDPLVTVDLSSVLSASEADLEAGARLGEVAFWLSSHGLRRDGDPRRSWFFATTVHDDGAAPEPFGVPYDSLLADLLADPALASLGLSRAHQIVPKAPGGLNLEGMTRTADGASLLIGFRNPRPEGRALVITLTNPLEVMDGGHAKFGPVERLALDGLGIRELALSNGRYVISAGAVDDEAPSRLYVWTGRSDPVAVDVDLQDFNPEAIVAWDDRPELLVLSDDGGVELDGDPCKHLKDASRKQFRGRWVTLP